MITSAFFAAVAGSGGGGAAAVAPVNNTLPSINDLSPGRGTMLTVSPGVWTPTPTSYSYQWLRDNAGILGATDPTYTLGNADVGTVITCDVVAHNGAESSDPVGVATATDIVFGAPVNDVPPSIGGNVAVESILTVLDGGTWNAYPGPDSPLTFLWDGAGIDLTNESYTTEVADIGNLIRCAVTAVNEHGSSTPALSNQIGPIEGE